MEKLPEFIPFSHPFYIGESAKQYIPPSNYNFLPDGLYSLIYKSKQCKTTSSTSTQYATEIMAPPEFSFETNPKRHASTLMSVNAMPYYPSFSSNISLLPKKSIINFEPLYKIVGSQLPQSSIQVSSSFADKLETPTDPQGQSTISSKSVANTNSSKLDNIQEEEEWNYTKPSCQSVRKNSKPKYKSGDPFPGNLLEQCKDQRLSQKLQKQIQNASISALNVAIDKVNK